MLESISMCDSAGMFEKSVYERGNMTGEENEKGETTGVLFKRCNSWDRGHTLRRWIVNKWVPNLESSRQVLVWEPSDITSWKHLYLSHLLFAQQKLNPSRKITPYRTWGTDFYILFVPASGELLNNIGGLNNSSFRRVSSVASFRLDLHRRCWPIYASVPST